jgi:hypothetical protein
MGSEFADQLLAAISADDHTQLFHARGCRCPNLNRLDLRATLAKFCSDFLPICPIIDPRGKSIRIIKSHFPKLVDIEHATLSKDEFSPSQIVKAIEDGTFDPTHYREPRGERKQMLFLVPDVLGDPDAIYKNGHKLVAGDEIYVRVYDKNGSKVKLVFTMDIRKKGKVISTVPITSFLTDANRAKQMVKGDPLYRRK